MPAPARIALLCLALSSPAAWAQAADSPTAGKALFLNTPSAGGAGIVKSCPQCHVSVQNRRAVISGTNDPFADISFDQAMTRFTQALRNQPDMREFSTLRLQQVRDIAAYLADTPETAPENESTITFTTTAVNVPSAAQRVTIRHGVAADDNLTIVGVAAAGTEAGNFDVQPACNGVVLTPGSSCSVDVTYNPRNTNASTPDLVVTLSEGTPATQFERVLFLAGSVASAPPPPATGGGDSGGGSLDGSWLAALAAAAGLLRRRRA